MRQPTCERSMNHVQGFIQDFEFGGGGGGGGVVGKQDGSRMIVACKTHACLLGGSGGMLPQENFELVIYLSDCF